MKKKSGMTVSHKIAELAVKGKKLRKPSFIHEMKEEMKKVSWTTKNELYTCGKIVVAAIFFLGLGIYLIDLFIRLSLDGISNLVRLIGA